jgi:hypothetical protein
MKQSLENLRPAVARMVNRGARSTMPVLGIECETRVDREHYDYWEHRPINS